MVDAVVCGAGCDRGRAGELAGRLGAPVLAGPDAPAGEGLFLVLGADGLSLASGGMELRCDLARMERRLRPGALGRELLVRAARIKGADGPLRAVDATAGFGEDALLLAASGFEVDLFERDPVIRALLEDGLERASRIPAVAPAAARMRVAGSDGIEGLARLGYRPDVVYLDPMFPERRKSAAVKKKFQLLHLLERPCADEGALLGAALGARPRKVVVKRPARGPLLDGARPSYSIAGKAVRYDVIVPPPATGSPAAR